MTLTEVIISFFVYLILGLITAKIAYKMFDYYPRSVFIIIGTIVAYLLEIFTFRNFVFSSKYTNRIYRIMDLFNNTFNI